uniref:ankyrin repeat-containing protein At5g02620-like n=1 Tax=Erigeron canadensis TaxID=72917 RepID=UPI001CB96354|nr:ankyrin repeat-containing protein At5g02620-like [Erigeron canadensis]
MGEQSDNPSLETLKLEPISTPTLNPESTLEATHTPTQDSEPEPHVSTEPNPEPEPIPQTETEQEPEPILTSHPQTETTSELEPTSTVTPNSDSALASQPETTHAQTHETQPEPHVSLEPEPEPITQTEIEHEPGPIPTTQIQIETTSQLEPTPTLAPATPTPQPQTETNVEPEPAYRPNIELLSDDRRTEYINLCVPLYKASIKGDWVAAEVILRSHKHLVRCAITENWETPLHVAASAESNTKSTSFVQNLVNMMLENELLLKNKGGDTPLNLAAAAGNVEIAKIMVRKNSLLPNIPNKSNMMPLYTAALFRNLQMVTYLYEVSVKMSDPCWEHQYKVWVFIKCVEADFFDIALQMLRDNPQIAEGGGGLGALAEKPDAFIEIKPNIISRLVNSVTCGKLGSATRECKALELLRQIWTNIEKMPKTKIDAILRGPELVINKKRTSKYPSRILFVAAEMGNINFLVELINRYPDLIWKQNDDKQSIFHVAVYHRRESIYNLLHEIGSIKALIYPMRDREDNNMLHLAGNIASKNRLEDVSGVAFQMQRELLWFKEVESKIPPYYTERRNQKGKTPRDLFTETHKELVYEGEKWMKGTASKCMVVAALIATIVFGVAYTIPGGYDQTNGFPKFRDNAPFIVFVMLDAISLILSSTSILVFLSILTSRYAQDDFIESLPKKLMLGLSMLFLSIVTMMIAFSVSFFVLYDHRYYLIIAGCISILALVPIISYVVLHFPLLEDMYHSTYGSKSLFKPKKQMLYYTNPSV